jgi:hypothetical protein
MPKKLDRIVYGKGKDITFAKFNIGEVLKAIANDLHEYGQAGVQGVKIKPDYAKLVDKGKKDKRHPSAHLMAGLLGKDLILLVHDKNDAAYEESAVLVPAYLKLQTDLADKAAAVVKLAADKDDATIKAAATARAGKFGTSVVEEEDASFGGVTGDIILCAHGSAAANSKGRVIGTALGRKSADDLVRLLTGNGDPRKNIGKSYNGVIRLSGCFTGSGGPEAHEADASLAKSVWDKLKRAGFTKCSVVGIPGPAKWAGKDGDKDGSGVPMKKGDPHSAVGVVDKKDLERFSAMMKEFGEISAEAARLKKLLAERQAKLAPIESQQKAATGDKKDALIKLQKKATDDVSEVIAKVMANDERMAELTKLLKKPEYAKLLKTQANVQGQFGLRTLN